MPLMSLVVRFLINAAALAVAAWLLPGITLEGATASDRALTLAIVAAIFGLVNVVVRPIVKLLTLPLIILTLGLVIFVINALMLLLTSRLTEELDVAFHVDGFDTALIGALIIAVVGWLVALVVPDRN